MNLRCPTRFRRRQPCPHHHVADPRSVPSGSSFDKTLVNGSGTSQNGPLRPAGARIHLPQHLGDGVGEGDDGGGRGHRAAKDWGAVLVGRVVRVRRDVLRVERVRLLAARDAPLREEADVYAWNAKVS
eukprot:gene11042-biopygen10690